MKHSLLLMACLILFTCCSAQQRIENLVFEGAGIRGIAYSGAIEAIEQQHLLTHVKRIGGTSAGAITALALCLGYSAGEITTLISSTDFKKFNDGRYFFIGGLHRVSRYYGWYRGQQFEAWLSKLIAAKTGDAGITFRQLHDRGYKDLYVTGTCLNRQATVVFSQENYPNMKVKDAVRISMSIPLYFEPVFIDPSGAVVHRPKDKKGLDVMMDGGFLANFPIRLFDSTRYFNPDTANTFTINPYTIGFRIDSKEQIEMDQNGKGLAVMPVTSFREYAAAFYNIIVENLNRSSLTPADWQRTVSIPDGKIGPRIRKLKASEIDTLITNGRSAAAGRIRTMSDEY